MDLGLRGKVALITGASKGIGLAIAEALAGEGMAIAAAARSARPLELLAEKIASHGGEALAHPADLSREDAPAAFVAAAVARFGRIDVIVNNAGATRRGDFLELTELDWHEGFALKFFGAVRLSRAAWPHLVARRGSIVNIAGIGGRTGTEEFTIGGSVNAAMLNLTKALADRGVREGVRVNAINPGSIRTDRLTARIAKLAAEASIPVEEAARRMTAAQGIARFGEPAHIAATVAFLVSEPAAHLSGAVIDIDGGATRTL